MSTRFSRGMSTPAMRAISFLSLPLLVLRLGADHEDRALAPDDPTLIAPLFQRCPPFHDSLVPDPSRDATSLEFIWTELDQALVAGYHANEIHSHLTRYMH